MSEQEFEDDFFKAYSAFEAILNLVSIHGALTCLEVMSKLPVMCITRANCALVADSIVGGVDQGCRWCDNLSEHKFVPGCGCRTMMLMRSGCASLAAQKAHASPR